MISREDYYKLHGDDGADDAATDALLLKVNELLVEAAAEGIVPPHDQISGNQCASGYRPSGVNARTANAAAASKHTTCHGVDVQDTLDGQRQLARFCCRDDFAMLKKHGLYMEDPRWTAGRTNSDPWVHLQDIAPRSGKHCYIPYSDTVKNPAQDPRFFERVGLPLPR